MDLFAVAKTAALEQRALELEKRNEDLLAQIESLKGGAAASGANIDDLNRVTAHKAWKDTVELLESKLKIRDAEIAKLRAASGSAVSSPVAGGGLSSVDWARIEAVHEDHARYRERMGQKVQELRSENEGLLRDLHRKEDECHELESRVEKLKRRVNMG
jgi:predicted RNase H-like nuclease (RuvC/YqgF family)